jgi:anaerobic ribonucleoside-triphosphate reductase
MYYTPKADKTTGMIGEGVRFERIRRITGYLVGTVDRFNNGKRAEERDRVKHADMRMEGWK